MPTTLERAHWLLNEFAHLASGRYPYVFGGGHGVNPVLGATFPPTKGLDPEGTNPKGYDCSAWQAAGLWHAGMLVSGGITNGNLAPGTLELAKWGEAGHGTYFTLFVRNSGGVEHCIGKLTLPGSPPLWTAGEHTGTTCGFFDYSNWNYEAEGYLPRHYPGG